MTLYELTKKYGEGKGEDMMWSTLQIVSDTIETAMDPEAKYKMMRQLYGQMSHGHYDQEYALADVAKMFYIDKVGAKHSAPYWNENQVREVYEQVKKEIPAGYNFWDFYVALQMTKSNTSELIEKWFPNATPEEREKKIVELAVNEFNDPDSPDNGHKIWAKLSKH